jgi:tetratricopeptide (TPR) repeat protein
VRSSLVVCALVLAPLAAAAQPRSAEGGEAHYQAGAAAYAQRRFREAAAEFRQAYALTSEPALLFNLGSALAADGQRDAAREALQAFLAAAPDAPNRAAVEARLRELAPVVAAPAPPPAVALAPAAPPVARTVARSPWPVAGAVTGGVGVLAAAVGLGLYLDVDAQFDRCAQSGCARDEQPRAQDAASVGLLWGGGALAVAGLVTWLVAPSTVRGTAARVYVAPTARGVALAGVF